MHTSIPCVVFYSTTKSTFIGLLLLLLLLLLSTCGDKIGNRGPILFGTPSFYHRRRDINGVKEK